MVFYGHGDPLFKAATKGETEVVLQDVTAKVSHATMGQGDTLFQEVQKHAAPNNPLHSDFKGHGDPLMDEYLKECDGGEVMGKGEVKRTMTHDEERKKHGDPLLEAEERHNVDAKVASIAKLLKTRIK